MQRPEGPSHVLFGEGNYRPKIVRLPRVFATEGTPRATPGRRGAFGTRLAR